MYCGNQGGREYSSVWGVVASAQGLDGHVGLRAARETASGGWSQAPSPGPHWLCSGQTPSFLCSEKEAAGWGVLVACLLLFVPQFPSVCTRNSNNIYRMGLTFKHVSALKRAWERVSLINVRKSYNFYFHVCHCCWEASRDPKTCPQRHKDISIYIG